MPLCRLGLGFAWRGHQYGHQIWAMRTQSWPAQSCPDLGIPRGHMQRHLLSPKSRIAALIESSLRCSSVNCLSATLTTSGVLVLVAKVTRRWIHTLSSETWSSWSSNTCCSPATASPSSVLSMIASWWVLKSCRRVSLAYQRDFWHSPRVRDGSMPFEIYQLSSEFS